MVASRADARRDRFEQRVDYVIRSNTIVAWIRSPPPSPLLPEAAVVMVWSR